MNMKKLISLVLCITLALTTVSFALADDVYTVKIAFVGDVTTEACEKVSAALSEITMAKFGCKVELVRYSYSSFAETVNLMLSSGEKLDLFPNFAFNTTTAAATGQIAALDELLQSNGQGILAAVEEGEWACASFGGSIYGVPNGKEKAAGIGIAVRKDVLAEVGYENATFTQLEDLTPMFAAMKEKYPDAYPLAADHGTLGYFWSYADQLGGEYGVIMNCTTTDEMKVENYYATQEYKDIIKLRYEWAQAGYIAPDAHTGTENASDLIAAGTSFCCFTNTKPGIEAEWERKVGQPMAVFQAVEPIKMTATVGNQWYISAQSENPQMSMNVLNELYTNPEMANLACNGLEGEHWIHDEANGVLVYPDGVNSANTPYTSVAWAWCNELITIPWVTDGATLWQDTLAFNGSASNSIALGFAWDSSNCLNEVAACNNVLTKYTNALACGQLNPDEAIPMFLSELKEAGHDAIIADIQSQLDAWAAGK